ncbi:MAG: hypothetical protein ABIY70_02385 [Capsulimonas sp.]|uniref:hypothetical protein n=1 Tax=Capsulimonas sp. TaxID=2494211 RepID=UPI0032653B7F
MKRFAIAAAILLSVFFAFTVMHKFQLVKREELRVERQNHRAYLSEIQLAQADGITFDTSNFNVPSPPPSEDAGLIYEHIDAELKAHPFSKDEKDALWAARRRRLPTPAEVARLRSFVLGRASLLKLIHQAVALKQCSFHTKWGRRHPYADDFQSGIVIDKLPNVLTAESIVLAEDGDWEAAVRNQCSGFRIADHLLTTRGASAHIRCTSTVRTILTGIRILTRLGAQKPSVLTAVQSSLSAPLPTPRLSRTLQDEITFNDIHLEMLRIVVLRSKNPDDIFIKNELMDWSPMRPFARNPRHWNSFMDANIAVLIHHLREDSKAADGPYPEVKAKFLMSRAELRRYSSPDYFLVKELTSDDIDDMPSIGDEDIGLLKSSANNDAEARVIQTAAVLLLWKLNHGAFPEKLSTLGPVPMDPFTSAPLRYRREGAGFVVYSVGEDGTFDGGSPGVRPKPYAPHFRFPTPAYELPRAEQTKKSGRV